MTHEETRQRTKTALAASLKKYMKKKPIGKITVSEIITDCNVNRKTFYYYFDDIYALFKWMLEQEAIEVVKRMNLLVDYKEAVVFVIDYVEENAHILNCAYDSLGREDMKRFFQEDFRHITRKLIDDVEQEENLSVLEDFKEFLVQFYTGALASMILDWFKEKNHRSKEEIIYYLMLVIKTSLPEMLRNAPKKS